MQLIQQLAIGSDPTLVSWFCICIMGTCSSGTSYHLIFGISRLMFVQVLPACMQSLFGLVFFFVTAAQIQSQFSHCPVSANVSDTF